MEKVDKRDETIKVATTTTPAVEPTDSAERDKQRADFERGRRLECQLLQNIIDNRLVQFSEAARITERLAKLPADSLDRPRLVEERHKIYADGEGAENLIATHPCATFEEHEAKTEFFDWSVRVGTPLADMANTIKHYIKGEDNEHRQVKVYQIFHTAFGDTIDLLHDETEHMTPDGFWCWATAYARARRGTRTDDMQPFDGMAKALEILESVPTFGSQTELRARNEAYIRRVTGRYGLEDARDLVVMGVSGQADMSKLSREEWESFLAEFEPIIIKCILQETVTHVGVDNDLVKLISTHTEALAEWDAAHTKYDVPGGKVPDEVDELGRQISSLEDKVGEYPCRTINDAAAKASFAIALVERSDVSVREQIAMDTLKSIAESVTQ